MHRVSFDDQGVVSPVETAESLTTKYGQADVERGWSVDEYFTAKL